MSFNIIIVNSNNIVFKYQVPLCITYVIPDSICFTKTTLVKKHEMENKLHEQTFDSI